MADPEVRDHPPLPISEHSRVLIAMHKRCAPTASV
jgi:hypothetical protein